jgi:hypothetical protein
MTVRMRRFLADGASETPRATVIIPTRAGDRNGRLARVESDLARQRFRDFEVIEIIGENRQGRAINRAARLARGTFIITLDDDSELYEPDTFERLLAAMDADPTIGIAGTSTLPGPGSSAFQKIAVREVPRRYFPVVKKTVDSDMVQHPCMAMRRDVFLALDGEDEDLVRGLDPLVRYKFRKAGYRVAIVAGAWISHPLPDDLGSIARIYFRNGRGSAFAQRTAPERIYELTDGFDGARGGQFTEQRPLWFRALRYFGRMYLAVLGLKVVRLTTDFSYLAGYAWELWTARGARGARQGL